MPLLRRASARLLTLAIVLAAGLSSWPSEPAAAVVVRDIVFPVQGGVSYTDDFGDPRGDHTHQGNDLVGTKLQKLLAPRDAEVTYLRHHAVGNLLILTDSEGWSYWFIHINNDTPGTDDGLNARDLAFPPGLEEGTDVLAGQHVAYMGDSGNAEATVAHLHFEIHDPDGTAVNPYASLQAAPRATALSGVAVAAHPVGGHYVLTSDGRVHTMGGAPHFGDSYLYGLARSMAVMPDGAGYVVLDSYGGVHRFGSAVTHLGGLSSPYWSGWNIARDIALTPSGGGFVVLDGWGGVHARGDAPKGPTTYWRGWDIARAVAVSASGGGIYVLDGWGGVHVSGDAVRASTPYWKGLDAGRDVVAASTGTGFAVLDAWGRVHATGTASAVTEEGIGARYRGLSRSDGSWLVVRADAYVFDLS